MCPTKTETNNRSPPVFFTTPFTANRGTIDPGQRALSAPTYQPAYHLRYQLRCELCVLSMTNASYVPISILATCVCLKCIIIHTHIALTDCERSSSAVFVCCAHSIRTPQPLNHPQLPQIACNANRSRFQPTHSTAHQKTCHCSNPSRRTCARVHYT